ncbi:S41 family peptidase [bacterium]|nr:S41 family peptidase [bacterium]
MLYGKGTVQRTHTFRDKTRLVYTVHYYLTPQGHLVNDIGISPDIIFKETPELSCGKDFLLEKALQYLASRERNPA